MQKGNTSVSNFGRKFKLVCDKLAAIGQPVDDMDKIHWFLYGLGSSFETFSTAIRTSKPSPVFRDLLSQAENHELFLQSIHGSSTPTVAFISQTRNSNTQGRSSYYPHGRGSRGNSNNGGRGRGGRRPPHCQLCRTNGHYVSSYPNLHTYASNSIPSAENIARAFHSQCHVTQGNPDWYVDSGATSHMTSSTNNVSHSAPYSGQEKQTSDSSRQM